jgi:hypothetical protein
MRNVVGMRERGSERGNKGKSEMTKQIEKLLQFETQSFCHSCLIFDQMNFKFLFAELEKCQIEY